MKKLALLSLITAGVALVSSVGANNGKQAKAYAEASSSTSFPSDYGQTRRIVIDCWDDGSATGIGYTAQIKMNNGTSYGAQYHDANNGDFYNEYNHGSTYKGMARYFDVPYDATQIEDINYNGGAELTGISLKNTFSGKFPIVLPSEPWAYLKFYFTISGNIKKEDPVFTFKEMSWVTDGEPGLLIPTIMEGFYSCGTNAISGYAAADEIQKHIDDYVSPEDWKTYKSYKITNLGWGTKQSITVEGKLAAMHAKNGSTPSGSLAIASSLSAKSYLWVIAIAGTAAIASITAVVIATDKKKRRKAK